MDLYPKPQHSLIIEPFAGSAKYAMKYWENDVILIEKYDVVYKLWKWLQECSSDDILKLPILKQGDDLNNFVFDCEEAKIFMGYLTAQGVAKPQNKAVFRATTHRPNWIKYSLERMSKDIEKIKHWDIRQGCYSDLQNVEATWFIDPPYQNGGHAYVKNQIDFISLGEWCKERNGQAIVCENTKADWLPFVPMKDMQGTMFKTTEAIWSNYKTNYDNIQIQLF